MSLTTLKVKSHHIPFHVTLYGGISGRSTSTISITSHSPQNIQPMLTQLEKLRFSSTDFISSSRSESSGNIHASPKKKLKKDNSSIIQKWQDATAEMMEAYEDDNDGLPDVGLMFSSTISQTIGSNARKMGGKGRRKQSTSISDTEDFTEEIKDNDGWTPEEHDDSIQVPGELVYAREKHGSTFYYPAQVIKYIPPSTMKQKPRYQVEFMDRSRKAIPRDRFFIADDDGFGTCPVSKACTSD
jgi:hypothetical protein